MTQRHGGFRSKTRQKLSKNYKTKGKISITKFFQTFEVGDKVVLKAEPAIQKGMYYPRFHGNSGIITGKQGNCYTVSMKDKHKVKELIVHPVHLRKD
ncbi:MAG: 50S ribosomal protein L21e [archaeon]